VNEVIYEAIEAIRTMIVKNKQYLTDLDSPIGDSDHGINMARGFDAVMLKLENSNDPDIASVLKKIGLALISSVGGASGPLYGTAFLRAAVPAQGKTDFNAVLVKDMLSAAIQGIKDRGKASQGEKTMIDALEPAYEAFSSGCDNGGTLLECFELASKAALEGVEFTKKIIATKGRASYLGNRSIGHQDPGATSSYLMLKALTDFCSKKEGEANDGRNCNCIAQQESC